MTSEREKLQIRDLPLLPTSTNGVMLSFSQLDFLGIVSPIAAAVIDDKEIRSVRLRRIADPRTSERRRVRPAVPGRKRFEGYCMRRSQRLSQAGCLSTLSGRSSLC
jgi:hypothetical protein